MKKIISLIIITALVFNIGISSGYDYDYSDSIIVTREFVNSDNPLTLSGSDLASNTVTIKYNVQAKPILEADLGISHPEREVVLVIDKSGSMGWGVNGVHNATPSRMSIARTAAKRFVNNLGKTPNVKVAVVQYSSGADILSGYVSGETKILFDLDVPAEKTKLLNLIDGINAGGGTNIGDGIRRGREVLDNNSGADKFMVVLSDGEPTVYTATSWNRDFEYKMNNGNSYYERSSNSRSLEYTKRMTRNFDYIVKDSKSYFVAFSSLEASNKLTAVANTIGAYHKLALNAEQMDDVYSDIAEDITANVSVKDIVFSEYLPNGLSFKSSTIPMAQIGNKLTAKLDDISYTLTEGGTYVANPIEFEVTYTVSKGGQHEFNQSTLNYVDINDDEGTKDFNALSLTANRTPVVGVSVNQVPGRNENQVTWDLYPGAIGYKVYKNVNGTIELVDNVVTTGLSKTVAITEDDESTTTYYVEAILSGDKSQKGSATASSTPQILNVTVQRNNEKFKLSWDDVPGANNYNVIPMFNGVDQSSISISSIDIVNGKVHYTYDLDPAFVYDDDDEIKFRVSGSKSNGTPITPGESPVFLLRQLVETAINATDLGSFHYAEEKVLNIEYKTVPSFPLGVNIYNPLLVFELNLPSQVTDTPLEYTYSTVDAFDGATPIDISTLRSSEGGIKVFVELNDVLGDPIATLASAKTIKLQINFAVAYGSENGVLKSEIFSKLKPIIPDMNVFEINQNIEELLIGKYTNPNSMLEVKSYILYNNSMKTVNGISNRDLIMGVSSDYIKLINVTPIDSEF